MAYDLQAVNGYGDGSLGDVENPTGQINSYANVTTYTTNTITIGEAANGIYEKFEVGKEIMLHVSATNGTSQEYKYLGRYMVCKITAASGSVLTLDKDFTQTLPTTEFAKYQVQAITIAQFKRLALSSDSISPQLYSTSEKYGGICLFKCSDTFSQTGGSINLVDKGIPIANTAYRPLTAQEINGNADTDKYSGWENHVTAREFLLNCGDGAVAFWAKKYFGSGTTSRIGGTTEGTQFARGNMGGSSILWVAEEIEGFSPTIISKRKGSGQGLGRCYIASKTKLRNDEGLYAYDCLSDPSRLMRDLNIKNYGNASLGDVINPTIPMNNYARVTSISADRKVIAYTGKTTTGMAPISVGSLVMFHVSKHIDSSDMDLLGKFILAKVIADDGMNMTLDTPVTKVFKASKFGKYNCQIISVAQFNNLTISSDYTYTTPWDDNVKIGGLCAISVKGLANIENGKINVESKGGGTAYAREGLGFIGNAQMCDILPLGQGHGSVFLLTSQCLMNENSRIGASHDGALIGGGTYRGGYKGKGGKYGGEGGGGNGGGGESTEESHKGGYGSNGFYTGRPPVTTPPRAVILQGGHLFIVINKLNLLHQSCFNTGTAYMTQNGSLPNSDAYSGSGYGTCGWSLGPNGGGGGYNGGGGGCDGGGGGSSGWMFIHVNIIEEFDPTGVIAI